MPSPKNKVAEYENYRRAASEALLSVYPFPPGTNCRLSDINAEALRQVAIWRQSGYKPGDARKPEWDWSYRLSKYRKRYKRIELAIWNGSDLCGLLLGRISDRKVVASIHILEGNPSDHAFKGDIASIATSYLDIFAKSLGCTEQSLEQPVPALINVYKDLGFDRVVSKHSKIVRLKKLS